MSEIVPNHDSSCYSQLAPFAFQSLNGLQAGQVFALESSKTVLQFDAADGSKHSPPTRCLVVQGPNGVAIRTIQGEMAVNDCIQQDAWLNVNDELSCGNARLRLIRQVEWVAADLEIPTPQATPNSGDETAGEPASASHSTLPNEPEIIPDAQLRDRVDSVPRSAAFDPSHEGPQVICDDLEHDTRCDATNDPNSPGSTNPPSSGFFSPFAFENGPDPSVDGQTMCLSPGELQGLLEPTVYGADDVGYIDSSAVDSPIQDFAEAAPETSCDPVAETWNPFNSETQPTTELEPEPAATDDFMPLPCDPEANLPCGELHFCQPSADYACGGPFIESQPPQLDDWTDVTGEPRQTCSPAETPSQHAIEAWPHEMLAPTIDNAVWPLPQWGQPSFSHVEIVDFGAVSQCQDFFHQVVEWQNQEPRTNPSSCDLKPQTDVHGVIIH